VKYSVLAGLSSVLKPLDNLRKVYVTANKNLFSTLKQATGFRSHRPPKFAISHHMIYKRHQKLSAKGCDYEKQTNTQTNWTLADFEGLVNDWCRPSSSAGLGPAVFCNWADLARSRQATSCSTTCTSTCLYNQIVLFAKCLIPAECFHPSIQQPGDLHRSTAKPLPAVSIQTLGISY